VEELSRVLKSPAKTPGELELRQKTLEKRVDALRDTGEMRRALELPDWRDDDEVLAGIDVPQRERIFKRFQKTLQDALASNDPTTQLAAASLLADIGPKLRTGAKATERTKRPRAAGSMMRVFAPDLVKLIHRSKDTAVRTAAARALGKINPDILTPDVKKSDQVAPTLGNLLTTGNLAERRAAAEALLNLVRVPTQLLKEKTGTFESDVWAGQAVANARVVVPEAGPGLRDRDIEVRRSAAQTIEEAAIALRDRIADARRDFPQGRELTEDEKKDLEDYKKEVAAEWEEVKPLTEVLRKETKDIISASSDPDPRVRLMARRTVEEMGVARQRLQKRAESVEMPAKGTGALEGATTVAYLGKGEALADTDQPAKDDKPLADSLRTAVPALMAGLTDPDVRARRAAAEALESLGNEAAPAIPALIRALGDGDFIVRWIAVRTLGKFGAKQSAGAIPALARLLDDSDLDVRVQAATVLGSFGPAAAEAVPSLLAGVGAGDATLAVMAIKALVSITKDAEQVVPTLIRALSARDARVRAAAAAALSKYGRAARSAANALRALLDDPDVEVRKAAGDALLGVTQGQ
jgi:HEAT repeat protein